MKRIGLICLAMVLALGTLGVGYAHWSDDADIIQTVQTGTVSIGFSKAAVVDILGDPKDIAWADAFLTGEQIGVDIMGRPIHEGVTFVIHNAYPGIQVAEVVDIASAGTIPVHIAGMTEASFHMAKTDPYLQELETQIVGGTGAPGDPLEVHFYDADGNVVMILWLVNAVGVQLHQGYFTSLEIHKFFQQPMQMSATYELTITLVGIQYNQA